MNVYVVCEYGWDYRNIVGVYTTRQKAQRAIIRMLKENKSLSLDIERFVVDK